MIHAQFQVEVSFVACYNTLQLITKLCNRLHYVELIAAKKLWDQFINLSCLISTKHEYKKIKTKSHIMPSLKYPIQMPHFLKLVWHCKVIKNKNLRLIFKSSIFDSTSVCGSIWKVKCFVNFNLLMCSLYVRPHMEKLMLSLWCFSSYSKPF